MVQPRGAIDNLNVVYMTVLGYNMVEEGCTDLVTARPSRTFQREDNRGRVPRRFPQISWHLVVWGTSVRNPARINSFAKEVRTSLGLYNNFAKERVPGIVPQLPVTSPSCMTTTVTPVSRFQVEVQCAMFSEHQLVSYLAAW